MTRLIKKGFKVAICEQTESPAEAKKRGSAAVVNRDVVRIITQGTLTDDTVLDAKSNNFLLAISVADSDVGVAWVDISTGDFHTISVKNNIASLSSVLGKFNPKEILVCDKIYDSALRPAFTGYENNVTTLTSARFNYESSKKRLTDFYEVSTLEVFGRFSNPEIISCGVLLDYIDITQKGQMPKLLRPKKLINNDFLEIDNASMRNLEIFMSTSGEKANSLMSVINDTITSGGSRLLAQYLGIPLVDIEKISKRYDMVDFFANNNDMRIKVRYLLGLTSDIERSLSRISCMRGGPRDLAAISSSLDLVPELRNTINGIGNVDKGIVEQQVPEELLSALENLGQYVDLCAKLKSALQEELPLLARDGNFIAEGFDPALDNFKNKRDKSKQLIADLQKKYQEDTTVSNLKITCNNQLGYYIEVTSRNGNFLLEKPDKYIHRQTMANAMRFVTNELIELEQEIKSAAEKSLVLELEIYENLCALVVEKSDEIIKTAKAFALIDVMSGFANISVNNNYNRPIVDNSFDFEVKGGRHPIVEQSLKKISGKDFIANDCDLEKRLWILTGPNMAGKSTYLRQNALLVIMAQIGCFVPAESLRMGVVDRLFSRVGASDDLARGHSTFMVEMIETATILNQATDRSLVILDEIGRGTATFDGLSIAWAVVEYLHDKIKCRALFATHYHELVALVAKLDSLALYTMKIKEWKGDVIFLHEIGQGAADRSYGIHVAKLAGVPEIVISRAQVILDELEAKDNKSAQRLVDELPLFNALMAKQESQQSAKDKEIISAIEDMSVDEMSPKQALDKIYELKKMLK